MKTVLIFVCTVAAVLCTPLSDDDKKFLAKVHNSCQLNPRTFCDEDKLKNLPNNIDDNQVGIHMRCMAERAGLMEPDGNLDLPVIKSKIASVTNDKSKVDGYVQKCAQQAETPEKTANLLWLCFIKSGIEYYHKL